MLRAKRERKTDWSIMFANPKGEEGIKSFFKQYLWPEKTLPDALYKWKYEENPAGNTLALIGKNQEGAVIASSMFVPWKMSINGTDFNACQWVDLFVAPEYRGQNIVDLTLQQGLKESRASAMPLCFAFPNNNSIPIHKKNNGFLLGFIRRYTKPLRVEYLLNRIPSLFLLPIGERVRVRGLIIKIISFFLNIILRLISKETYCLNLSGFKFEKAQSCGKEFDKLWQRCRNALGKKIGVCKDSAYLSWKYANSPNKNRQIYALKKGETLCGFAALESTPEIGYIVDILAESQNALNCLIAGSIRHFRSRGKNSAVFTTLENHPYLKNLKSFGFLERSEKTHFYIYPDDNLKEREFFLDSRNWFITIGDCDIEAL
jgi:hypothetical protein